MDTAAMNFSAKISSLESVISEKDKALCLYNEENHRLKEKFAELEKGRLIQNHQEDPEVIKQESTEIVLRDIEVEPHTSPRRSNRRDLQYKELVELNSSLEIESGALKVTDKKMWIILVVPLRKSRKEAGVHFSIYYEVSKEFVEIEKKLSVERTENRSANLPYTFPGSFISFSKIRIQCKFSFYWLIQVRGFE